MASIGDFMSRGHKDCDEAFARAEESAGSDWPATEAKFRIFVRSMQQHFAMEEEVLFPAFEEQTGMSGGGPTETMRVEHEQMRRLFEEMQQAVAARDAEQYLGLCETLMLLMQQHNLKEENMMYPMLDEAVGAQSADLIGRCNSLEPA
jgi:iron-sulfur cluster repair protein YtfE (RIC family)